MASALTVRKHHGLNLPNFKCQAVPTFNQVNLETQYTLGIATVVRVGVKSVCSQATMFNPSYTASDVRAASSVPHTLSNTSALATQNY